MMNNIFMMCFFFFKQKTAYELRISDWSSDVCSSDLVGARVRLAHADAVEGFAARDRRQEAFALFFRAEAQQQGAALPVGDPVRRYRRAGGQHLLQHDEIGRASCWERVCQYWLSSVVRVSFKKNKA